MIYKTKPWDHQQEAYDFAFDKSAVALFMDMGTGKSKVVIDLIMNRGHQKTLVVCPKRVIKVWPKQVEDHADGLNVVALNKGTGVTKALEIKNYKGPFPVVFVANYDIIWRNSMISTLLNYGFDFVVLDESHRIKKPGGKASFFCKRLGVITPYKAILTGTPMPHSPLDVYGQYRFLAPHVFGTRFDKMESRYVRKGGYKNRENVEYINQEELSNKMYSIAYRVTNDVLNIPDVIPDQIFDVDMPPDTRRIYNMVKKHSVIPTEGGLVAINNTLTQYLRMHQLTSGIGQDFEGNTIELDTAKSEMLEDILEDLPIHEPVVVFARFIVDLDNIKKVCKKQGRRYSEVSGRADNLKEWQDGNSDVVGVQIQSGSEGEDYTRSHYAIYYSLGFSLKDYLQSRARIDRPGQTKNPVFIHILTSKTIDKIIMKALAEKKEVVDYVMDVYQNDKGEEE